MVTSTGKIQSKYGDIKNILNVSVVNVGASKLRITAMRTSAKKTKTPFR